jgi:hypothetical protein
MSRPGQPTEEAGQALVLLIGLVVLVLMVLALGWDTSNWFLGHRALANLADGAAVAAANDVDTRAWYLSGGRSVRVAEERARATVVAYLAGSAGDSGIAGARLGSVEVVPGEGGPEVTVRVTAPARAGPAAPAPPDPSRDGGPSGGHGSSGAAVADLERRVEGGAWCGAPCPWRRPNGGGGRCAGP